LPRTLSITHQFVDAFTLIAPNELAEKFSALPKSRFYPWLTEQTWILLDEKTNTGHRLREWMTGKNLKVEPSIQLDNFDLIITLVSIGMGISFVPIRALALYGQKKRLVRLPLPDRFERELVVLMRRHRKQPEHLKQFVKNVLF
jgi:DNA-binding transcriptional LysR family regulator